MGVKNRRSNKKKKKGNTEQKKRCGTFVKHAGKKKNAHLQIFKLEIGISTLAAESLGFITRKNESGAKLFERMVLSKLLQQSPIKIG